MIVEIPGVGNVEFPDGTSPEAMKQALAKYVTPKAPPNPAEANMRSITDQAIAAFDAGNDAEGKRLLAEASRVSVDSGIAPEGYVVNPEGQMEDLRSPANPNIPTGRGVSLGVGALQGLGFGGGDEAVAALHGATGGNYDYELARMREVERRAQEDHAGYYYGGLVPGAVASSVGAGKALGINPQGANLMGTMGKGAAIGAGEGTLWGALSGEGGPANRAKNAIVNAILGGFTGGIAPAVVAGGAKAYNAGKDFVGGGFDAMLNRANQGRANRALMDTLRKSGQSVDDVSAVVERAAREGQPEFRLMDATGKAGQRRASGVVRSGGDGAEELAQFLEGRQMDQAGRVGSFVKDAYGFNKPQPVPGTNVIPQGYVFRETPSQVLAKPQKSAAQTVDALKAARGNAADAAYDAARKGAGPVDVRGALSIIDDRIGGMQGSNITGDGLDATLSKFRNRLAADPAPNGEISRELSDFDRVLGVKQELEDVIGEAVRKGRNNEARELGKLKSALDQALEGASDKYRAANDGFRDASRVIDAVGEGAEMARSSNRSVDTLINFNRMNPDQKAAARVGYGDSLLTKVEANSSPTANRAKIFTSPKVAAESREMATNPVLLNDRIARENAMWETQNRALGGSRTADNLADTADLGGVADAGRAIKDALTGRIGSAIGGAARMAGNAATGQNEATRTLIAKMLMSGDPKQALAQALKQEVTNQGRRRVIEAFVRSAGRQAIPQF